MPDYRQQNPENLIALITDGKNPHFGQPARVLRYIALEDGGAGKFELLYADNSTELIPENRKGFEVFVRAAGRTNGNGLLNLLNAHIQAGGTLEEFSRFYTNLFRTKKRDSIRTS